MSRAPLLGAALVVATLTSGPAIADETPQVLDADGCVRVALRESGTVAEAQAKIDEFRARLAEVESTFYPKLVGRTYLAPMFTVHGTALTTDVERRWKSPKDWGPYAHFEALMALPLYTFGRAERGAEAARERMEVERARYEQAKNLLALEVRKLYYTQLYAVSLQAPLASAAKSVAEAEAQAKELYDQATGDVTQVDLSKLHYASTEVAKFERMASDGASLALAALKHTMGLPDAAPLSLADDSLPGLSEQTESDADLPTLLTASEQRPEWSQLAHGEKAALALKKSEAAANWPILFLAGQLSADWTPQRDDAKNPYWYDPYNQVFGGIAIGLQFDVDPAKAAARVEGAEATQAQVDALRKFAATGIPLQVRKAQLEVLEQRALAELSKEGVKATRKWLAFAAAAYKTGTGEARDLLEGLVAYLQAKRGEYDALLAYHIAHAELDYAIGRSVAEAP